MADTSDVLNLEQIQDQLDAGAFREARELAEATLETVRATAEERELGALHLAWVEAGLGLGQPTSELGARCREALEYARGHAELETRVRLAMLRIGLELGEFRADADDALVWLGERRSKLTPARLEQLILAEALSARLRGEDLSEILLRGVDELRGTVHERAMRLEHALAILTADFASEEIDALVAEIATGEATSRERSLIETIAWNHSAQLREDTLARVIAWAEEMAPHLCGILLARRGQLEAALGILRAGAQSPIDRVRERSIHALLEFLPDDAEDERLACAEAMEAILDDQEHAPTRHDVAMAMCLVARARRDPELMERALANADQAARGFVGANENPGAELALGLVLEVIGLRASRPTAELAAFARRLVQPVHEVDARLLAEVRASSAMHMSRFGPICAPEVLATAVMLAGLAQIDMAEHRGLPIVEARCRWSLALLRGRVEPPGSWPAGELDDAPSWLIQLVLGSDASVSLAELRPFVGRLALVVHARPDRADHLLAALVPAWEAATDEGTRELEEAIANAVEMNASVGPEVWSELRAALCEVERSPRPAWLLGMEATIARARGEKAEDDELPEDIEGTAEERADLLFRRARHLSEDIWRYDEGAREAASAKARRWWTEALAVARELGDARLEFHGLVGLGNALRKGEPHDPDGALVAFMGAVEIGSDDDQALATLCKVTADALCDRGRPEDLRRATRLVERSIKRRSGCLRAEALMSAARIAEHHPDHDEAGRLRRSIAHLMGATRADRKFGAELVPDLCRRIAEIRRLDSPMNTNTLLDQLERRYPDQAVELRQARHGVGRVVEASIVDMMASVLMDADAQFVTGLQVRLTDPDEQLAKMLSSPRGLSKRERRQARKQLVKDCLLRKPKHLERELRQLRAGASNADTLGRAVGQVLVVRVLVNGGHRPGQELRAATQAAREAIAASTKPIEVRAYMLLLLGTLWQSLDGRNAEAIVDFELSAELARDGMELLGGPEQAPSDFLGLLARAYRYTQAGDRNTNLRRSRDLYAQLHQRALAEGNGDEAAHALNNQIDAEMEMAVGDRIERLRDAIERLHHAHELARAPARHAEIRGSIAFYMQALANHVDAREQLALLQSALSIYESIDLSVTPLAANLRENHQRCIAALARAREGAGAEAVIWEHHLADSELSGSDRANAQHNLALQLRRGQDVNAQQVRRALELFEASIAVREPESARHAWETALEAGLLIAEALHARSGLSPSLLPWSRREALRRGQAWLERTIVAAEKLGRGEELADAALVLAWLATASTDAQHLAALAERAWSSVRRATPYLVLSDVERGREAWTARRVAVRLAELSLENGVVGVGRAGVCALAPGESELVLRWLLRAQASARWPLHARLQRPESASAAWWSSWQDALDHRNALALGRLLEQLHDDEPGYLCEELTLDETWAWLQGERGSVALAVILGEPLAVCVQLSVDEDGRRTALALALPMTVPPGDEELIAKELEPMIAGKPTALMAYEILVDWASEPWSGRSSNSWALRRPQCCGVRARSFAWSRRRRSGLVCPLPVRTAWR